MSVLFQFTMRDLYKHVEFVKIKISENEQHSLKKLCIETNSCFEI